LASDPELPKKTRLNVPPASSFSFSASSIWARLE